MGKQVEAVDSSQENMAFKRRYETKILDYTDTKTDP